MSFKGAGLTSFVYSKQTALYVKPEHIHREAELFERKWWDYRFYLDDNDGQFYPMHPMEATHLFFHHYLTHYKFYHQRRKGHNIRYNAPVKSVDLLQNSSTTITGIWKARRAADFLGIPYDFWCDKCMKFGEIFDKQFLPRPQHLYSTRNSYDPTKVSVVEFVKQSWNKLRSERKISPKSSFYKTENYFAHPYQDEHLSLLKKELSESANKAVFVVINVYTNGFMSEENIIEVLGKSDGEEILKDAKRLIS